MKIHSTLTLQFTVQGHEEIVWAVEVQGPRLFSASADKTIRVWDIDSRRCERVSATAVRVPAYPWPLSEPTSR